MHAYALQNRDQRTIDPASLSPDGNVLAIRAGDELEVTDLSQDRTRSATVPGLSHVVCLADTVLAFVRDERWTVQRFDLDAGALDAPLELPISRDRIGLVVARTAASEIVVTADRRVRVIVESGRLVAEALPTDGDAACIAPGWRIERAGVGLMLRRSDALFGLESPRDLSTGARISSGAALANNLSAVELRGAGVHCLLVHDLGSGRLRNRFQLTGIDHVGFVEERAHAVLVRLDGAMSVVDLASGRCVRQVPTIGPLEVLACDARGCRLVMATATGKIVVSPYPVHAVVPAQVEQRREGAAEVEAVDPPPAHDPDPDPSLASDEPDEECTLSIAPLEALVPVTSCAPMSDEDREAYLRAMARLIVARARRAAADNARPGEVDAVREAIDARWAGPEVPHRAIAADLELSPLAADILWAIAAPQVFGELGRLYRSLSADPSRPLCDELLVATLLGADVLARVAIARELEADAPLVRSGAVAIGTGVAPFVSLSVDRAVIRRLRGDRDTDAPRGVSVVRPRDIEEIEAPRPALASLVNMLTRRRSAPARIVISGGPGSGRRTVAASLAARAGRRLGVIRVDTDPAASETLRARLAQARLRGWLPCVDITACDSDPSAMTAVREVLDEHCGPLFVRSERDAPPPLAPGYLALDLPTPSMTARRSLWEHAAERSGMTADTEQLASRFAVGPGLIVRAAEQVAERSRAGDVTGALADAVRQHRDERISRIADRVHHLPSWSQLVLSADVLDSVHELVARIRHRRRALEEWGFEQIASTARGTTALFQGAPGTGKTLVAGVIARELGFELYRIDLSRIMSKWIGETEKNLAAVFDAAEGGDAILLFDEADALFAKRTEVKSSNDRFANVAVNYLLQRLDSFTGVAILTTNFGTSIDPAFRRRMSFRLTFALPDAAERERLWAAHIPAKCPTSGDLDLAELARRYEMSGGYIRNAALRAAFLAAHDDRPLSAAHLDRAIRAEYRDSGHLHAGRLQ